MKNISFLLVYFFFMLSCSSDSVDVVVLPSEEESEEQPMEENPDNETEGASEFDNGVMRNLSSNQIVAEMKIGWNLGNSLDAEGDNETVWGNPVTTKAMIDEVAQRGFNTLRLPVTWRFHQGAAPDYLIEESWLDRVEEVVNYARANSMYVIVNVHHDDTWLIPTYEEGDEVKVRLSALWTQVANRFKNYSDYLIFETLNEPRFENSPEEWSGGTAEGRDMVNQYHKTSLEAIRATGGNNSSRKIMIATYAASTLPVAMNALEIPNNDVNTIVSLHSYFPFPFTLEGTDTTWGTDDDKAQLTAEMDRIKAKFVDDGKAVVLGEWSSGNQNNTNDRLTHATFYANAAAERGLSSIWWDNGNSGVSNDGLAIFDRQNLSWPFGEIADAIIEAYK